MLFSRLKKAAFPGGALDFSERVEEARSLSEKVRESPQPPSKKGAAVIPITEANARLLNLRLVPSPSGLDFRYYRRLADQDTNLALAGLRMEIEAMARNLTIGFKLPFSKTDAAGKLLRRLLDAGKITSEQSRLGETILRLCNAAVHGERVTLEQANSVIDVADVLRDQYLNWLSWGFEDDWKPKQGT